MLIVLKRQTDVVPRKWMKSHEVIDFTPFVESYLAFDVIHILRRLLALFRNAIEFNSGRIIETAGDGFYAVFGFETPIKKAVTNAYSAGYQIFKHLNDFNCSYMGNISDTGSL